MSTAPDCRTLTLALIGNPNTGKSTLFSGLSGVRQRVGNYPGVTVEKKVGRMTIAGRQFSLVDLPGTYSLAPRSPDEMIAVDVLLGRRRDVDNPDAVLCIVDASNLERNLYLVSQVLELGLPTVIALNMTDLLVERGMTLDVDRLRRQLKVPVVEIQANRKIGLDRLKTVLIEVVDAEVAPRESPFAKEFCQEVAALEESLGDGLEEPRGDGLEESRGDGAKPRLPRYLIERLILDTSGYLEDAALPGVDEHVKSRLPDIRARLAEAGLSVPGVEAMSRYKWAAEVLDGVVTRPDQRPVTWSDRLDRLLTHRLWGTLVFVFMMLLLFQTVYYIAEPASAAIDLGKGWISGFVEAGLAEAALRSLLVQGVIEGVGSVLVFLPQIFALFLFIAVLEDCGYMARAAYLMDRVMSRVGLSGKSFIPLLSSFACAIPGIMSARVIENPRDRLVTILVAPLMSCSARLPVYVLLIGAFIDDRRFLGGVLGLRGATMFAMYGIGIVAAVLVAFVLKKTVLRGATPPFVMELPSYKVPSLRLVLHRVVERGWAFVRRAGTLIFAVTVVVWAAAYYPRSPEVIDARLSARHAELMRDIEARQAEVPPGAAGPNELNDRRDPVTLDDLQAQLSQVENEMQGTYLRHSFLGRAGRLVEPVVRPLGWDWKIGCAVIASFPAREVVIATLGVIYNLGEGADEHSEDLRQTLANATWEGTRRPVFNTPVALSIMVFFALCAQCASTLAVMRRETNSWLWPAVTFGYMTGLAYVSALLTYQVGMLLVS